MTGSNAPNEPGSGDTSFDVRRALLGDAAAIDRVVRRLEPLLIADARYRLKKVGVVDVDAEDVVAEAWAVALPKLGRIGVEDRRRTPVLLAFLATTLRNVVGTLARRRSVRGNATSLDASASARPPEPAASATGVVTRAVRDERRDAVTAALERLDPIDREILVLRGVEQRSASEAADALGLSPSAASMRYRRALERLRSEIPDSVLDDLVDDG
jgi:RNA polymerase sigma-70 factor, ECF subfamily